MGRLAGAIEDVQRFGETMTSREKIIKILIVKQNLIKQETGLDYIDKEDLAEVKAWSAKECKKIISEMVNMFYEDNISDISICPWCCLFYYADCRQCSYGKRHGKCYEQGTWYKNIIKALNHRSIYEISSLTKNIKEILKVR